MVVIIGCGGDFQRLTIPVVQASGPLCFDEFFSPLAGHVQETQDSLWFTTRQACNIETEQDETYILQFSHDVQTVIIQMGSNAGSLFEWDVILTVTRPDGRSIVIQQQYDKHQDISGNKQVAYAVNWRLPAGTQINIHRRSQASGACVRSGPWGTHSACATGQSVQFIGTLP